MERKKECEQYKEKAIGTSGRVSVACGCECGTLDENRAG